MYTYGHGHVCMYRYDGHTYRDEMRHIMPMWLMRHSGHWREKGRGAIKRWIDKAKGVEYLRHKSMYVCMYVCIYIYIWIDG